MKIKEKNALCIFIKNPEASKMNAFLQPHITPHQAVRFYLALIKDFIQDAYLSNSFDLVIFYPNHSNPDKISSWLGKGLVMEQLPDGTLINKIEFAFETAFKKGYKKTIVICSDVPEINHIFIKDAFHQLTEHDAVFGPTFNENIYLMGLKKMDKKLFAIDHIQILDGLTKSIKKTKGSYKLLKEFPEIDFPVDLQQLWTRINALPGALQLHRFKHTYSICQELFN